MLILPTGVVPAGAEELLTVVLQCCMEPFRKCY